MNTRRAAQGFTLVEMMAVVVIIGLLAAVIAPKFFNQVDNARRTTAKQEIVTISDAITMYRFDTNKFPEELRDLRVDPDVKGWNGPYIQKKAIDPWDAEYQYRVPGNDDREFDLFSYGADGEEGGEGSNEDILSWEKEDE